jgi:carbonic anhydrase
MPAVRAICAVIGGLAMADIDRLLTRLESRRRFLLSAALAGAGCVLAACGEEAPPPSARPQAAPPEAKPVAAASGSAKPGPAHWAYEGHDGPEGWGHLDTAYAVCGAGKAQTPIDLPAAAAPGSKPVHFGYRESKVNFLHNGHTIQVNYDKGSAIVAEGKQYELVQFHFHTPSEHVLSGKPFAMEMHLVHQAAADKSLAVLGIMFDVGPADNPFLAKFWNRMPTKEGTVPTDIAINVTDVLPPDRRFLAYDGSLTTPPCSEGVKWMVMPTPVTASAGQLLKFMQVIGKNARPLQPLNGRQIGTFQPV